MAFLKNIFGGKEKAADHIILLKYGMRQGAFGFSVR